MRRSERGAAPDLLRISRHMDSRLHSTRNRFQALIMEFSAQLWVIWAVAGFLGAAITVQAQSAPVAELTQILELMKTGRYAEGRIRLGILQRQYPNDSTVNDALAALVKQLAIPVAPQVQSVAVPTPRPVISPKPVAPLRPTLPAKPEVVPKPAPVANTRPEAASTNAITELELNQVFELAKQEQWAEAERRLRTLRLRYPEDEKLNQAATLLENQGTKLPASITNVSASLPSSARLEFFTLNAILNEAQAEQRSLQARRAKLEEFLQRSVAFVQQYTNEQSIWLGRAVAAAELDRSEAGMAAALALQRLGAVDSSDDSVMKVIALLNRKGWLMSEEEYQARAKRGDPSNATRNEPFVNSLGMRFVPLPGNELLFSVWETRKGDYAAYARGKTGLDNSWQSAVYRESSEMRSDDFPVANVSWNDANAFCEWLTQKELADGRLAKGARYRLPTDLEWSAAVGLANEVGKSPKERDGKTDGVYPWGREWPPPASAGNYADITAKARFADLAILENYRDGFSTTAPVGSFSPNEYGLLDLSGNVLEWCQDPYAPGDSRRVLRGASWRGNDSTHLLSSFRYLNAPSSRLYDIGFRCVLAGAWTVKEPGPPTRSGESLP